MEKGLEKTLGLDHFGKLSAFEYENYHYRYENEIYSFTLDFINEPNEKMTTSLESKSNSYNTVKLTIKNNSDKDIIFGSKNKRERIDNRKIEDVITMPDFQFIIIPGLVETNLKLTALVRKKIKIDFMQKVIHQVIQIPNFLQFI